MKILLVNEAGCFTPSITALAKELSRSHRVVIVAPLDPLRGAGHALTTNYKPLRAKQWFVMRDIKIWSVSGTPCDCVSLALDKLLKSKPDLIISGIDAQNNVGEMLRTSGVVSGAIEGAIQGFKSIALSAVINDPNNEREFAKVARAFSKKLPEIYKTMTRGEVVNINFPSNPKASQIVATHITCDTVQNKYKLEVNPFMRSFAWLQNRTVGYGLEALESRGDIYWLKRGFITLTPLTLDILNKSAVSAVENANFKI
ncbi:MAG: 5'/3'-nucleotidase SurE [Christensenellaceae bacterium]|jgi:5'-nucleotidase|nr:5'/3'-nucleotidase SurE [Christensenellaceae bacterium]